MDGASLGKENLYVLTPMAVPGIASTLLLNVILAWNEAFWTLQLSTSKAAPLTAFASYSSPEGLFYAKLSAASTMGIAPILKNIAFPLQMAGMPPAEQDRRVEDAARILNRSNYLDRRPGQLSGGQRQRVALARSVAKRPKVLLLDEPLGALDKKLREETQFELMDLQQELGLTFVVVTHDQEEAMTMADRIAILDKGEVMQVATPAEIYEAPKTRFVANFVGNINMFDGTITSRDGDGARIQGPNGLAIKTENPGDAQPGSAVSYAVRPEKIIVSSRKPAETAVNVAEGEIFDIAYLGDMTVYHVKLGDGQIVTASALNRARIVEDPLTWSDRAWISFRPDSGVVLTR